MNNPKKWQNVLNIVKHRKMYNSSACRECHTSSIIFLPNWNDKRCFMSITVFPDYNETSKEHKKAISSAHQIDANFLHEFPVRLLIGAKFQVERWFIEGEKRRTLYSSQYISLNAQNIKTQYDSII